MSTDYHTAQGDFSSIVYRLQPMVLSNFVMWLDLKVAEFKVYGQMLLDEQDTNCSKWFLRTGLGQDVPPHAKQKERTSNVHVGTTERPKRSSTSVVSKPAKQTRIDISDEEENIEFKTKSILPLEASGMLEEFNQFQEQMNSFISSAANQAVQNSSPATQLFGRTKTLPSRQSPIQQQEKKHSEHDVPKHIVVKKTLSPVFDIIQSHSADSSLSSDLSNLSRPTSEASSQRPLPVLSQTSQFETPHSQQLPTAVSSSTILPQSDSKPVVKVEPTDSEYDESAMDRIAPFSEMSSENTPSSMYLVPNVAMTGDTNSNVSGQTRTVTHSDGIMYFSTQSDSEALQTDDKSGWFDTDSARFGVASGQWTEETMSQAVAFYKLQSLNSDQKVPLRKVASLFGVPKSTLGHRISGRPSKKVVHKIMPYFRVAVFCDSILNTSDNTSAEVIKFNKLLFNCDWMTVKQGELKSHWFRRKKEAVSNTDITGLNHWPAVLVKKRTCKQCAKRKLRAEPRTGCEQCNVNLCVGCFKQYHKEKFPQLFE